MVPVRQASGKVAGKGFDVAVNPEFLREGSAVKDFFDPPFVAVGSERRQAGECVVRAYKSFSAPVVQTDLRTACLLKYFSNSFHGLKVAFANEIGILARAYGVDSHVLLKLFVQDTKLNISPAYLKPGFAFGGSWSVEGPEGIARRLAENEGDIALDRSRPAKQSASPGPVRENARALFAKEDRSGRVELQGGHG